MVKMVKNTLTLTMCDIRPVDIVRWQNSLAGSARAGGDGFKPTYLRIINN